MTEITSSTICPFFIHADQRGLDLDFNSFRHRSLPSQSRQLQVTAQKQQARPVAFNASTINADRERRLTHDVLRPIRLVHESLKFLVEVILSLGTSRCASLPGLSSLSRTSAWCRVCVIAASSASPASRVVCTTASDASLRTATTRRASHRTALSGVTAASFVVSVVADSKTTFSNAFTCVGERQVKLTQQPGARAEFPMRRLRVSFDRTGGSRTQP